MRYGEFIFYNTNNLSMTEKLSLLRDCMEISYDWRADTLDCAVSTSRQHLNCSFEEALSFLNKNSHVVVINRGVWGCPFGKDKEHFEIGFRSMDSPIDYFLFIQVETDKMSPILKKYRLEPIS